MNSKFESVIDFLQTLFDPTGKSLLKYTMIQPCNLMMSSYVKRFLC